MTETKRMFEYIIELKPHKVSNTTSLNNSRKIIIKLSRPLQEFAQAIRENIEKFEKKERIKEALGKEAEDFNSKLMFEGVNLERQNLDYPRTVCVHKDCTENVPFGRDQVMQPTYPKHCHPLCTLGGSVKPESIGDPYLIGILVLQDWSSWFCIQMKDKH